MSPEYTGIHKVSPEYRNTPLLEIVNQPWRKFLSFDIKSTEIELFRKHERTGRPLGNDPFIKKMESLLDRKLKPQKPGPKKKDK
jgi:putative transposase